MTDIITIYDGPNCMKCRMTKRNLVNLGVPYRTEPAHLPDGTINPTIADLGYQTLPVVTMTDARGNITAHWSDFKVDNIKAAAYLAGDSA